MSTFSIEIHDYEIVREDWLYCPISPWKLLIYRHLRESGFMKVTIKAVEHLFNKKRFLCEAEEWVAPTDSGKGE